MSEAVAGNEQPEPEAGEEAFLKLHLRGAKPIDLDPTTFTRIEVSEGGLFIIEQDGETNIYSPSAWSLIETNLDI